jgi:hypothetical protein
MKNWLLNQLPVVRDLGFVVWGLGGTQADHKPQTTNNGIDAFEHGSCDLKRGIFPFLHV